MPRYWDERLVTQTVTKSLEQQRNEFSDFIQKAKAIKESVKKKKKKKI